MIGSVYVKPEKECIMKNKNLGVISVLLAGSLWGTISIFLNYLDVYGFSTMQLCFLRSIAAVAVLLAIILIKDPRLLKIKWKDLWLFLCTGCLSLTLFDFCYFYTIQQSEASIAVAFLYSSPVFVTIISAFVFHEKITPKKILAIGIALLGVFLVSGVFGMDRMPAKLLFTGIAAGLLYGLYLIFGRLASLKYSSMTITFYTFLFSGLSQLPFASLSTIGAHMVPDARQWLLIAGMGVINTVLPYLFFTLGLSVMEPSRASVLSTIEVVAGSLVGILLFHESYGFWKILGLVLIISATVVLNVNFRKQKSPQENPGKPRS